MVSYSRRNDRSRSRRCSCCDNRIRLLNDPQSLALFIGLKSAQRRAHQCMSCGQILCNDCHDNGFQCACGCNAWVALPCLEGSTVEAGKPEPATAAHGVTESYRHPENVVLLDD